MQRCQRLKYHLWELINSAFQQGGGRGERHSGKLLLLLLRRVRDTDEADGEELPLPGRKP